MKKTLFALAFCLMSIGMTAQENTVNRLPEKPHRAAYKNYGENESGYWLAAELSGGSMADVSRRNLPFGEATVVNGYRFDEFLRVGIGFGVKYYASNDDVRRSSIPWAFPLYVDVRGNMISQNDRTVVPYWSADVGAEIRNGMFFSPTIGVRIGEARSSVLIGVTYRIGAMDTWKKNNETRNMFALKIGYEF